ncbi:hypothetical protein ACWGDE_05735 [Streptomyces sp. NPDC054956]
MKLTRVRALRAAVPAAVAGMLLPLIMATPAHAAGAVAVRYGGTVLYTAASGATNQLTLLDAGAELRLTDTAGITAGFGCQQDSPTSIRCGARATVTRLQAALGDGNDKLDYNTSSTFAVSANGGTGVDEIKTGPGNDMIDLRDGAADLPTQCGAGFDSVLADTADTGFSGCERVLRS